MKPNENKITLYADLKEVASTETGSQFGLPPEEERQPDIQYIYGVFVSSGMNLNGAVFLPSELILARDSMLGKALDVEHIEYASVGHISRRAFMTKGGDVFSPAELLVEMGADIEGASFDIAILSQLWKYRHPDIAEEVSAGKYKLSMECYYKDIDIQIGNVIVSLADAEKAGVPIAEILKLSGQTVRVTMPDGVQTQATIGRVLRGITFSGVGLVEDPANPESIIREAATNSNPLNNDSLLHVDLSACREFQTVIKNSGETENSFTKPSDSITVKTPGSTASPAETARSRNPGTCVSFKKYVFSYEPPTPGLPSVDGEDQVQLPNIPGVGDNVGPDDKIVAARWCALFDTECTTLAGDATDARCLRNVFRSATSDVISSHEKLNNLSYLSPEWFERWEKEMEEFKKLQDD